MKGTLRMSVAGRVFHLMASIVFSVLSKSTLADGARQLTKTLYAALLEELDGAHLRIAATNVRSE